VLSTKRKDTRKFDCPRLKNKKEESKSEANIAKADGHDSNSSVFLLSTNLTVCNSEESERILDTDATYNVVSKIVNLM